MPPRRSATNLELSMEGYPAEWPNVGPFQESLSHCPFVEDATKAFLECRSRKSPWPSGPQEDSSSSLPLPPPPPPPPTFTLGLSEHLPQLPSEHREASTKPKKKRYLRKRLSSEPSLCSVAGTDGQQPKKKGSRREVED